MEYIKFGKDERSETLRNIRSEYDPMKITSNNTLYSTEKRIQPVKQLPGSFKKERIENRKETVTKRKTTDEYDDCDIIDEDTIKNTGSESVFTKILCGIMASALLFIGVYLSQIKAPEYMETAVLTLVKRAKEASEAQVSAEENIKTIGAKVLIENNRQIKEDKTGEINLEKTDPMQENESFAQTIRSAESRSLQNAEIKGSVVMAEQAEDVAVEVVAKNMSRGSDKLYFTNKTDLDIDINKYLSVEYPIESTENTVESPPKVLIIHTHGTEAYIDTADDANSRSKDTSKNIVRVGEELQKILISYGIPTIHSKTMHDEISYVNAYANSKKEAKEYLEKYPSIKYIIDIHRDALGTETSPVKTYTEINGKKTAQLMFVMGTNAAGGNHPNFEKNLTTAAHLYKEANVLFPSLMRPVSIRPIIFNQDLTVGSMILEVGSNANTLEEAISAVRMFGRVLAEKEVGFKI